ncbi:alpha/beta hydrolase [Glycomyces sp. TRM65418]|uniref:alpha/beta fold hydrolase n=1 Tax=Glycomyces sp. TRM65418 TaxID=2867006 RepID=UPI001CE4BC7C|nr:alpha/beta hydrolase [Glycomyces sp. TRM65418]MCC3765051.1 alpha/beta hydrolase [Glycomyces sp. TRM65418]QZD54681.1 alpha/beta hydrolase [Glycomyces sp. TRM65418]
MDIILIPGFWLDASSWSEITPALERAGHRAHPLTLPGMESREADRSGIGLRDHIDAVVAAVDAIDAPVVLVGHSGGGAIAHAVADKRPDRIARVIYVDSAPLGAGGVINDELPVVDGEIPLPDWNVFEDEDLVDLDDGLRASFRARSIPTPKGVAFDEQQLGDERRFDVPITVICCEFSSAMVKAWVEQNLPFVKELVAIKDVSYIDLPTGHWPQFTKPAELADAILSAVGRD